MRVSREQVAKNRERVVDTAAKLFRENGFGGAGVAEIMKAAGLTHGGFYGHFSSKDDLAARASERALADSLARWEARAEEDGALEEIVGSYLSARHRDAPGSGCAFAALGGEAAREGPEVRRTFTEGIRGRVAVLTRLMRGPNETVRRERALATLSGLVGALVLSRVVDDPELSDEILAAARKVHTEAQRARR